MKYIGIMKIVGDFEKTWGEALLKRGGDRLIIRDRYKSMEYIVDKGTEIEVSPARPNHVPANLTKHMLIDLEAPIYSVEPMMMWVTAPYELDIRLDGESIAYLSPVKVKYYLYGDAVEGVLCRYHQTKLYMDEPMEEGDMASLKVLITKVSKPIKQLLIPLEGIHVYEDSEKIYYNPILVEGVGDEVVLKVVDRDPHKITVYDVPVLSEEYGGKWRYRI